jgi:chromosome segregation ATPase
MKKWSRREALEYLLTMSFPKRVTSIFKKQRPVSVSVDTEVQGIIHSNGASQDLSDTQFRDNLINLYEQTQEIKGGESRSGETQGDKTQGDEIAKHAIDIQQSQAINVSIKLLLDGLRNKFDVYEGELQQYEKILEQHEQFLLIKNTALNNLQYAVNRKERELNLLLTKLQYADKEIEKRTILINQKMYLVGGQFMERYHKKIMPCKQMIVNLRTSVSKIVYHELRHDEDDNIQAIRTRAGLKISDNGNYIKLIYPNEYNEFEGLLDIIEEIKDMLNML